MYYNIDNRTHLDRGDFSWFFGFSVFVVTTVGQSCGFKASREGGGRGEGRGGIASLATCNRRLERWDFSWFFEFFMFVVITVGQSCGFKANREGGGREGGGGGIASSATCNRRLERRDFSGSFGVFISVVTTVGQSCEFKASRDWEVV